MRSFKSGGVLIRLNESQAVKTEEERGAVLEEIGSIAFRAIAERIAENESKQP
ncbi:MAG: hypothetical protein LUC97_02540 [Clostridiales bacterium]|nr:hypothetical protein [Clostridiales bacterium]MCD8214514.1 hypothetical protein [Clostridiales bacterium]MCD8362760.1 hypothetical protein [Lachnospiraceae bacterium]